MRIIACLLAIALVATPSLAGNSLVPSGQSVQVAKSAMSVTPSSEWNRLGRRPGKNGEIWTLDGDGLNKITFYGAIAPGTTLFREVDKKNKPLPRFSTTMLPTDYPAFLENSYRIALGTAIFSIESMEPVKLGGADGIRFSYSFVEGGKEVQRKGEGRAALIKGQLYMITYEAPSLHFFDKSISQFNQIADSVKF